MFWGRSPNPAGCAAKVSDESARRGNYPQRVPGRDGLERKSKSKKHNSLRMRNTIDIAQHETLPKDSLIDPQTGWKECGADK